MKRKLVKHGESTLTVSLPPKWIEKYKLQKGDQVDVEEQGRWLKISSDNELSIDKVSVDVSNFKKHTIEWTTTILNKSGYDEAEVLFNNPKIIPIIQNRLKQLMGFVIVEQTDNRCLIKAIVKSMEEEFDTTLRRAFLVTLSLSEGVLEHVKKGTLADLKDLLTLEESNNQLTCFCQRILNKNGYKDHRKTSFVYVILWILESIADDYKLICEHFSDKKVKISKETIDLFEKVNNLLRDFYELFYKYDEKRMVEITEKRNEIGGLAFKLLKSKKNDEVVMINLLDRIAQRVDESLGSLMGYWFGNKQENL